MMQNKTILFWVMTTLLCVSPLEKLFADNPPNTVDRIILEEDDPIEEQFDLVVYLNTATGQISVETYVNQWLWVYIFDVKTNTICSFDVIDPLYNYGNTYHTFAPTTIGNYCILFCSEAAQAWGFFSIN